MSIRYETLNRIEGAKVSADTATIAKIDDALKRAEAGGAAVAPNGRQPRRQTAKTCGSWPDVSLA